MNVSKQALALRGVTIDDYIAWCEKNNKPSYKNTSKNEFFSKINKGLLVRDSKTNELIEKYSTSKPEDIPQGV